MVMGPSVEAKGPKVVKTLIPLSVQRTVPEVPMPS